MLHITATGVVKEFKAPSFCGFAVTVIGALLLLVSAAAQSQYQTDYTGAWYGIGTITAGLLTAEVSLSPGSSSV